MRRRREKEGLERGRKGVEVGERGGKGGGGGDGGNRRREGEEEK